MQSVQSAREQTLVDALKEGIIAREPRARRAPPSGRPPASCACTASLYASGSGRRSLYALRRENLSEIGEHSMAWHRIGREFPSPSNPLPSARSHLGRQVLDKVAVALDTAPVPEPRVHHTVRMTVVAVDSLRHDLWQARQRRPSPERCLLSAQRFK